MNIVKNSTSTMKKARKLSNKFTTVGCKKPFLFILQLFQFDLNQGDMNTFDNKVYKPISEFTSSSCDGMDISYIFKGSNDYSSY